MKLRQKIVAALIVVPAVIVAWTAWYMSHDSECLPPATPAKGQPTMQAIQYRCYGGTEVLEQVQVVKPEPGQNEMLVRIEAAAVNPLDWHYMRGKPYIMRLMGAGAGAPADRRMGVDYSGVVEAVGESVTRFKPGDRVFGGHKGAFAQFSVVAEDSAVAVIPRDMSFEQAAAVPIAGVTAIQALRDKGQLKPGQKVLVNGASGGVGTFAVQIARAMGAEVHGVCSTPNVERVLSLGADRVYDYKKESYLDSTERYDLIIDNVGNHSLLDNRKVMTENATLVIVGGPDGNWIGPMMRPISAMIINPFIGETFQMLMARMKKDDLEALADFMAEEKVRPVIDRSFSLAEVADAIRYSETGRARGKIIINVD
jgi:NADPH:quinone reductase-like Zn-dependent oxidoreductase